MSKKSVFSENDFNSGDGMLTSVWGPALWHSLHTISFNYPVNPSDEQKKQYYNFFKSLQHVLPCRYCRENYTLNLEKLPLTIETLKNRESLSRWLYEMHELINKNLGKESGLSYEDVRNRYEHFRARCLLETKKPEKTNKFKKEKGCTEPLYGVKSKCILNIVPKDSKVKTFKMDPKCKIKK
jgi:hypothetical protein